MSCAKRWAVRRWKTWMKYDLVAFWEQINSGLKVLPRVFRDCLLVTASMSTAMDWKLVPTPMLKCNSQCDDSCRWALWEMSRSQGWKPQTGFEPWNPRELSYLPDAMGRGGFSGPDLADTLIADFPSSRAVWKWFLFSESPILWWC